MSSHFILLRLPNFAYKSGRKPLGRLPLKRVLILEKKLSLANLLLPVMTGEKAIEKGKKPIASSNTPTPMTSDSYAMDASFTLVTRSRAKLSKKTSGGYHSDEAFYLFNTAMCRYSIDTYCLFHFKGIFSPLNLPERGCSRSIFSSS